MARVLIVATNDDNQTRTTFFWAKELQRYLAEAGHETVFLGEYDVTFTGLTNAIASAYPRIEYVVFYGHGDHDRLYGQRTDATAEQAPILVDDLHADVFRGANVYAVACYALDILGEAHQRDNPTAHFIGYNDLFAKSEYDFDLFRLCVHHGAVLFVAGMDGHAASSILKKCWGDSGINTSPRHPRDDSHSIKSGQPSPRTSMLKGLGTSSKILACSTVS